MPGAGLPPRETTKQDTQTDVLLWHARRDSNPQPSEPESDALSITLLAHVLFDCQIIIAKGQGIVKGNFHEFYEIFPGRTVGKTGREGLPPGGFHGRVVFVKLDAFASQKQPKGVLIVSFSFSVPTNLVFGQGAIQKLHKQRLPGKKALIVISSGKSTRANGYLDTVQDQLTQAGVEYAVFDKVSANPVVDTVMDGAAFARANGCDFVLGLGGGSSIDAAKAIAMMAPNEGNFWDYVYGGTGGGQKMKNKPLPIVAIPTTAGTGTEVDAWTVVTNEATNEKMSGGNKTTFPVLSIVDPDFMLSVPPKFTAFQGFDALFHSTESYINKNNNLMRDMLALKAIESVGRNLAAACANGQDKQARELVAFGSSLSGMVMSVDNLCSEHSLEHPLSAYHPAIAHGEGLIMVSKAYYTHFVEHCPELHDRFIDMAKAMGKEDAKDPMDFVTALVELQKACGVDNLKMSDYGITPEEFPKFVSNARSTMGILFKLDRLQLSDEDLVKIYTESYR